MDQEAFGIFDEDILVLIGEFKPGTEALAVDACENLW